MITLHPPSQLLAIALDRKGLASFNSESESPTPAAYGLSFGGIMPQEDEFDKWVAITDYGNWNQGRLMSTGAYQLNPRIQIRVRDREYEQGYVQIAKIMAYLFQTTDAEGGEGLLAVQPYWLTVGITTYAISNVSFVSGPVFLGNEDKNKRLSFACNVQMTIDTE